MVLKLSKPVNSIKPIRIANKATVEGIKNGDKLKAVGYGSKHGMIITRILNQTDVNFYSLSQCRAYAKKLGLESQIKGDGICTRDDAPDNQPNGFCAWDYGAPLLKYNQNQSRYEIVGLYSASVGNKLCKARGVDFSVRPTAYAACVDSVLNTGYSIK